MVVAGCWLWLDSAGQYLFSSYAPDRFFSRRNCRDVAVAVASPGTLLLCCLGNISAKYSSLDYCSQLQALSSHPLIAF